MNFLSSIETKANRIELFVKIFYAIPSGVLKLILIWYNYKYISCSAMVITIYFNIRAFSLYIHLII